MVFHDTRSHDSRSNDARFIQNYSNKLKLYRENYATGKLNFAEENTSPTSGKKVDENLPLFRYQKFLPFFGKIKLTDIFSNSSLFLSRARVQVKLLREHSIE